MINQVSISPNIDGPIAELLSVTGLDQPMVTLPYYMQQITRRCRIAQITDDKLVKVLNQSVHSEDVRHVVEEAFATRLSDEDIQTALAFLDTDLGKKVMQCQRRAINRFVKDGPSTEGLAATLNEERLRLLAELDEAAGTSAYRTKLLMDIQRAMLDGLTMSLSEEQPMSAQQINQLVAQQTAELHRHTRAVTQEAMAWTYQPLSDEELREFLENIKLPAARHLFATGQAVSTHAITDAIRHYIMRNTEQEAE